MFVVPEHVEARAAGRQQHRVAGDGEALRGRGASVEYVADFEFQGLFKLLAPLMALPLKRLGDKGAQGMAEALATL